MGLSLNYPLAVLALLVLLIGATTRRRFSKPSLPPGPKGLPIIGNVRDLPPSHEWVTYAKWSRQYNSDVIHLKLLGSHLVILNSAEAAYDLLDKRSTIYSDRPRLPMLVELVEWDSILFHPYGNRWRANRRLFNQFFNLNAVANLQPQMVKATDEFLHRIAHDPEEFLDHIHLWAASFILNITYGIDVQARNNPYLTLVEGATKTVQLAGNPGAFLVNTVPLLKHVPSWLPGAGFKKQAEIWKKDVEEFSQVPFEFVKNNMEAGTHTPSLTSMSLDRLEPGDGEDAQILIRSATAAAFAAGSDTTISSLTTFFLAMVLHPGAQKKAQEELDRVVGHDRLPEFSDQPSLPYVHALLKEVYRWKPVVPLGFSHKVAQDDVYKGHFIPAGSLVLGNIWAILHDPNTYKDPEKFIPERFLKDGELDPDSKSTDTAFGFGRRICPGRHLGHSSLFLAISNVLSKFDIGYAVDEKGQVIIPSEEFTSGTVIHPLPFKCSVKPRSKRALDLVNDSYAAYHP